MSLRTSTAWSKAVNGIGRASVVGQVVDDNISFTNSPATIDRAAGSFITDGFNVGDEIYCKGEGGAGSNNGDNFTVTSLAALSMGLASAPVTEAASVYYSIASALGITCGGLRDLLRNGILYIQSAPQASSPDDALPGTTLMQVTVDGGVFVAGAPDNGLNWGDSVDRVISKESGETWKATGLQPGTAQSFRFCANPADAGLEDTAKELVRIDGSVGVSGADLLLVSTAIVVDDIYYINSAAFTMPMQYGA